MRILHAIHNFLPRHRAGSEIYAFYLCRELARRHDVSVLCAEYDPSQAHGSLNWRVYEGLPVVEVINNWAFSSFDETYQSPALDRSLGHVLSAIGPDILHVHSLLNLSMELPTLARARGIPSVATLHDYTLVCPSGGQRVHVAEEHVCDVIEPERCGRCFPQSQLHAQMALSPVARIAAKASALRRVADVARRRLPAAFSVVARRAAPPPATAIAAAEIVRRLDKVRQVFETIDLFVAPSAALAHEYEALGLSRDKLRVSDYGFVPMAAPHRSVESELRIGFVGTLVWHKGAHVLIEAIASLPSDRFVLKIFGDTTVFPAYVRTLRERARNLPVRFMGGFDESRTREVYGEIDVLVVPSLWPENSPLVIHEAFMAGVPVVGARQGGIPELVTHGVNGLIYEAYSPADLTCALRRLIDDPTLLGRFAKACPPVKSVEQDAAEWQDIYESVVVRAAAPAGIGP